MCDSLSSYPLSVLKTANLSIMFLASLNLMLMQISLQANIVLTYGPSFVITHFVLSKVLAGFNLVSSHLPIRSV